MTTPGLAGGGILPRVGVLPTWTLFLVAGIAAGVVYLVVAGRRAGGQPHGALEIVCSALIFGMLGSKVPLLFTPPGADPLLQGKSIVGGLLGGMAGVLVVKRVLGIRTRMGNLIAPAAALGMGIGRIGCFLNGCCYGLPVAWGVDFGDGVRRYPTQLFEAAFDLTAFVVLHRLRRTVRRPGVLFGWFRRGVPGVPLPHRIPPRAARRLGRAHVDPAHLRRGHRRGAGQARVAIPADRRGHLPWRTTTPVTAICSGTAS